MWTQQGLSQNSVRDLVQPPATLLVILKMSSLQTANGLHSPHTPSFLDSRVRIHQAYIEVRADNWIGDGQDVNVFVDAVKPRGIPPPGLPQFDPNRVVSHPDDCR